MEYLAGFLYAILAAWTVWIPVREHRRASRTGQPELSFSRMLIRMVVAGCVVIIGALLLFNSLILPGRSPLFVALYWLGSMILAMVMLLAGFVEYLFVKRDLLLSQKAMIRELARRSGSAESGE